MKPAIDFRTALRIQGSHLDKISNAVLGCPVLYWWIDSNLFFHCSQKDIELDLESAKNLSCRALPYLGNSLSTASSNPELFSLVSLPVITLKELISMNLVYECRNESVLPNNCFLF